LEAMLEQQKREKEREIIRQQDNAAKKKAVQ
jgi:hypothetical protein